MHLFREWRRRKKRNEWKWKPLNWVSVVAEKMVVSLYFLSLYYANNFLLYIFVLLIFSLLHISVYLLICMFHRFISDIFMSNSLINHWRSYVAYCYESYFILHICTVQLGIVGYIMFIGKSFDTKSIVLQLQFFQDFANTLIL